MAGQNGEAHEASPLRGGARRGPGPGGARPRGGARPDAPGAARRLAGDRARRGRDDAPPGHQPARPEGRRARLRHDRRLRHRRRRRVLADVQLRLGADGLRLRSLAAADALRRRRGASTAATTPGRTLAHGPAGPGEEHRGDGRSATTATASSSPTTPPIPAAAAASRSTRSRWTRTTRAASTSPRAPPTRRSPARPPRRRCCSARRTAGARGRGVTAFASERDLRAAGGAAAAKAPRVHALGETGVYEGAGGAWQHFAAPGGARFTLRRASAATRARASCSPTPRCRCAAERGRRSRAACRCPRTAAAPGTRRTARCSRPCARPAAGDEWGPAKGSRPSLGPIAASAHFPLVAYVGLRGIVLPGRGDAPFNGIAKTTRRRPDAGASSTRSRTSRRRTSRPRGSSRAPRRTATPSGSTRPTTSRWRPNDPDVAYATDLFRTLPDDRRRPAWAQVNSERRGDDRWTTRGLDVTTTYGVQFDPHDPQRVFIPYTDIGLFRSEDGGETWTGSTTGIPTPLAQHDLLARVRPRGEGPRLGRLQRDPRPAAPEDVAAHRPRALPGRRRRLDGRRAALDASRTRAWRSRRSRTCSLDPKSPKGSRTLYAAAFGRGVYKSTDNGRTWALKNAGLAPIRGTSPSPGGSRSPPDGTLYLVVARRSERGRIGDRDDGALYRSTDGAETLAADAAAAGHERPERAHGGPGRTRSGSTSRPGA